MSSREDFHVNLSALLESDEVPKTSDGFGPNSTGLFALLSLDGLWLKTCQGFYQLLLDGSLEEFCETWPASGLMSNGVCYQRAPWVPHTHEKDCSYWATPRASRRGVTADLTRRRLKKGGCRSLESDLAQRGHRGPVNPNWQEWLMGFPIGFTDLEVSETP